MDFDTLWGMADKARGRPRLAARDVSFVRDVAPERAALLIAGQNALGRRFGGSWRFARPVNAAMLHSTLGDAH